MNELDEVWAGMLETALAKAEAENRRDVADYISLKAMNDAIRHASVEWMFGAMLEIAGDNPQVTIENENSHRFSFAGASYVGALLRLRQGVRCLTVEAGWTRTPNDGFMRGGALAAARLVHFGLAKHNAELLLINMNGSPSWFAINKDGTRAVFTSINLNEHYRIFLGAD